MEAPRRQQNYAIWLHCSFKTRPIGVLITTRAFYVTVTLPLQYIQRVICATLIWLGPQHAIALSEHTMLRQAMSHSRILRPILPKKLHVRLVCLCARRFLYDMVLHDEGQSPPRRKPATASKAAKNKILNKLDIRGRRRSS